MKVLITGGAGYIGSTVASACEDAGHGVVILDDFSTGRREFVGARTLYEGDIADAALLDRIFAENDVDAVVHCAAKIVVPDMAARVIDRAMQVHGAAGFSQDFFLAEAYAYARYMRMGDGPDQVHLAALGKALLKRHGSAPEVGHV